MTITAAQADRIEEKLDLIITHFSIGDDHCSAVEIRERARKDAEIWKARQLRPKKDKGKVIPYERRARIDGSDNHHRDLWMPIDFPS